MEISGTRVEFCIIAIMSNFSLLQSCPSFERGGGNLHNDAGRTHIETWFLTVAGDLRRAMRSSFRPRVGAVCVRGVIRFAARTCHRRMNAGGYRKECRAMKFTRVDVIMYDVNRDAWDNEYPA